MECKYKSLKSDSKHSLVLIETYWNVNCIAAVMCWLQVVVLIETYWNVNCIIQKRPNRLPQSINRNILECKLLRDAEDENKLPVLIETYWNVNEGFTGTPK